ncbi:MAG: hypothetical protein RR990_08995 [Lachnospiraceae bacterium]
MEQKDFLLDFDLYICERYGYRNSLHVTPTMNGCCVDVNIKPVKLYIRFWEYSKGVGGFPDWCIILVHCNFAKKQEQELQELVQFFKEYAPRYGYRHIGIKDNPRLNQVLRFQRIQSVRGQENYIENLAI